VGEPVETVLSEVLSLLLERLEKCRYLGPNLRGPCVTARRTAPASLANIGPADSRKAWPVLSAWKSHGAARSARPATLRGCRAVNATVSVPRTASLEQVHAWSDAIEQRVGEIVPSDVVVHAEPRAPKGEPFFDSIRAVAQKKGLAIHDLSAQQNDGRLFVELHLEVDPHLSLKDAHRQATELEEQIRELRQEQTEVNIHIEPLGTAISSIDAGAADLRELARAVEEFLNGLPAEFHELVNSHNVIARQVEHHILASCHCVMRSDLPITQVHDVTAALEDRVKEKFPQIYRVTIHPEPQED